jgi:hypothetical protein
MKKIVCLFVCFFTGSVNAGVFRTVDANNTIATNGSWSFGTIFTIGIDDVNVTSIGAFDYLGDGFTSSSIQVGIFDETSNSLLASTAVSSTDTLIGDYRYTSITDLLLTAGDTYRLVALSASDLYSYYNATYDSPFTIDGYGYCSTTILISCDDNAGFDFGMANFQYDDIATPSVPEPTPLALLALGLVGLGFSRIKKSS